MRTLKNGWRSVTATLILVMRQGTILLGQKKYGFMKGFVTPIGGKVDKSDKTIKDGAKRELFEETNLEALELYEVGTISIRIAGLKLILYLHVFKCKGRGRVKNSSREFTYLKYFPINKITWDNLIPGDRDWLEKILHGNRIKARIMCGDSRADLREIRIWILP